MVKNEQTSERVASLASKILGMENPRIITDAFWKEIQAVAGSALTQAPDKPKTLAQLYAEQSYKNQLIEEEKRLKNNRFLQNYFNTKI